MNGTTILSPWRVKLGTLVIAAVAVGYFVFAAQWLANPVDMAAPLGITLANADATSDARAVYGGLELGVGAFLGWCAASRLRHRHGFVAALCTLWGLGLSRAAGIAVASTPITAATQQLVATDFFSAVLATACFFLRFPGGRRDAD